MNKNFLLIPLAAVALTLSRPVNAQEPERKISIEITTTENGNTTTKSIDLNDATDAEIQQALREMGIMDHFVINGTDENVVIDIRRFGAGEDGENTFRYRTMPPVPPVPPTPPLPRVGQEKHTWLGISNQKLSEETIASQKLRVKDGVEVIQVMDGSPAKIAGLQAGDVITSFDGRPVIDPGGLSDLVRAQKPGDKVKITYYRNGKKENVTVTLAEREEKQVYRHHPRDGKDMHHWGDHEGRQEWKRYMEPRAFLGVTPGERAEGVTGAVIGGVEEGSAGEKIGLQQDDIVRSMNGEPVESFRELSRKIRAMKPGDPVTLMIDRNGAEQELTGELGERKGFFGMTMPEGENFRFHIDGLPDGESFKFDFEGLGETEREKLREEMDKLRQEMEKLRGDLGRDLRSETRIIIENRRLTDEEKAMLKNKGVEGLDNELELPELNTFPNPSHGFFRIHFDVPASGDLEVDVHDASGDRVYQERITGFKGRYERTLDLSDKAAGTYYLVVRQGGKATTRKLVKQ